MSGKVAQDDRDGFFEPGEPRMSFCGVSTRVEIPEPGLALHVLVYEAEDIRVMGVGVWVQVNLIPWVDRCRDDSIATTGTVTATFSR